MSARASGYIKALTLCPNGELISAREKLVAMVLADSHQDRARRFTFPSVDTIAEEARCDRRSCQRFLSALERKGVIRRLRPSNQGAGMHTFYFFPALDEIPEGWQDAALFPEFSTEGRAAKGRVKGRQKGGSVPPLHNSTRAREVTVTETTEANTTPQPPSHGEGGVVANNKPDEPRGQRREPTSRPNLESIIDLVMSGCRFTSRRLRKTIRAVLDSEAEKGILPSATALSMKAAWEDYCKAADRLRWTHGNPKNFFENGFWTRPESWPWEKLDKADLEMQRLRASQGMV